MNQVDRRPRRRPASYAISTVLVLMSAPLAHAYRDLQQGKREQANRNNKAATTQSFIPADYAISFPKAIRPQQFPVLAKFPLD